jgi:hypothetical protein
MGRKGGKRVSAQIQMRQIAKAKSSPNPKPSHDSAPNLQKRRKFLATFWPVRSKSVPAMKRWFPLEPVVEPVFCPRRAHVGVAHFLSL